MTAGVAMLARLTIAERARLLCLVRVPGMDERDLQGRMPVMLVLGGGGLLGGRQATICPMDLVSHTPACPCVCALAGRPAVPAGGFDGRGGWVASKLQIKPYTSGGSFIAAPSFGRTGTIPTFTRKSLPAPKA